MSQPNIEIAKNCYAAFRRGEIPAILSALTDDVEWITPGKVNPTSGNRKGRPRSPISLKSSAIPGTLRPSNHGNSLPREIP